MRTEGIVYVPDIVPSSSCLSKYIQEQKLVVLFYFTHKLDRWFYAVDNVDETH